MQFWCKPHPRQVAAGSSQGYIYIKVCVSLYIYTYAYPYAYTKDISTPIISTLQLPDVGTQAIAEGGHSSDILSSLAGFSGRGHSI